MLTARQKQHLDYIVGYMEASGGVSPSFTEMSTALRTSRGHVHKTLLALEERGAIQRLHKRARAIVVLKRPEPRVVRSQRPLLNTLASGYRFFVVEKDAEGWPQLVPLKRSDSA